MGDLTKNLSRHEMECSCGCGLDTMDWETLEVVQDACDHFDAKVTVNSGCRCEEYNSRIGGSSNSQHTKCRAMDIVIQGVSPEEVWGYLSGLYVTKYGIGKYESFTHIDTRTKGPERWEG